MLCVNFVLQRIRSKKATLEELQSCHAVMYSEIFGGNPYNRQRLMGKLLFCSSPSYLFVI